MDYILTIQPIDTLFRNYCTLDSHTLLNILVKSDYYPL